MLYSNCGDSVSAVLTRCLVIGNEAGTDGGGIYNAGTLALNSTVDVGNSALLGRDLYNQPESLITLNRSVVGNQA